MQAPKLSPVERLILANQYKILVAISDQNVSTYQNNAEILRRGYTGLYHTIFENISEEVPEQAFTETMDIFDMFRGIEDSIGALNPEQQAQLNQTRLRFEGFDGNNDVHYGIANFLIKKQGFYSEHTNSKMNSHTSSSLGRYRRQLAIFNHVTQTAAVNDLTFEQLQQIAAV
jgi:hypothetical protein